MNKPMPENGPFPRLAKLQLPMPKAYKDYEQYYKDLLNINGPDDTVLVLGEIANMPGHYAIVVSGGGKTIFGLHPEIFVDVE